MKFEKVNSSNAPTQLSDEIIILANRWQDREARKKEEFDAPHQTEAQRERVAMAFRDLSNSIVSSVKDPWRVSRYSPSRGKDARQVGAYREAAEQHLEELMDRYAEDPIREIPAYLVAKQED